MPKYTARDCHRHSRARIIQNAQVLSHRIDQHNWLEYSTHFHANVLRQDGDFPSSFVSLPESKLKVRVFITPPMTDPWDDCIFTFAYMKTINIQPFMDR